MTYQMNVASSAWMRAERPKPLPARIIDEGVPAPVLRLPVISHAEVLRILADKPILPKGQVSPIV